jgi:hypothetical protein
LRGVTGLATYRTWEEFPKEEVFTFDPWICHRGCQEPGLTVLETTGPIEELMPVGARITLEHWHQTGTRTVAALA